MTPYYLTRRLVGVVALGWLLVSLPLAHADERWVILGGDIAETIDALNADIDVVARDDTVVYPPEMEALPSVGYLRQLSAESVLSVAPDYVMAASHAGPLEVLEQLSAVGIDVEIINAPATLEGIPAKVRAVAKLTGRQQEGETLAKALTDTLERLAALPSLSSISTMFILQHSGLTPRVAGQETAAHTALEAVGLSNAFDTMTGYHNVSAEALAEEAPELVIISARGLAAVGGEEALWQLPGMALTPASRQQRLIVIDDQALLGFGPRTPDQLVTLRRHVETLMKSTTTDQASR